MCGILKAEFTFYFTQHLSYLIYPIRKEEGAIRSLFANFGYHIRKEEGATSDFRTRLDGKIDAKWSFSSHNYGFMDGISTNQHSF